MKDLFVSYEQTLALKELGFESPYPIGGYQGGKVFYYEKGKLYYDGRPMYSSDAHSGQLLAPLKQQVFEWFRNVHNYHVSIRKRYFQNVDEVEYNYFIYPPNSNEHLEHNLLDEYESWEEAEIACIDDLIKLVKQK